MNIKFSGSAPGTDKGINSCCYRIMGILEQNIEDQDRVRARAEDRQPRKCDIKSEYRNSGKNADLEKFLRSVGITLENFQQVAEHKVPFNARQRGDISKALGVAEDAIWY